MRRETLDRGALSIKGEALKVSGTNSFAGRWEVRRLREVVPDTFSSFDTFNSLIYPEASLQYISDMGA